MTPSLPTGFQKKALWTAITAVSLVVTAAIVVGLIWLTTLTLGFLQPVLVPVAVAAVLAYLLTPLVLKLERRGVPKKRASLIVFIGFMIFGAVLAVSVGVSATRQAGDLLKVFPRTTEEFERVLDQKFVNPLGRLQDRFGEDSLLAPLFDWLPFSSSDPPASESGPAPAEEPTNGGTVNQTLPAPPPSDANVGAATPETDAPLSEDVPALSVDGSASLSPAGSVLTDPDPAAASLDSDEIHLDLGAVRTWVLDQLPLFWKNLWLFVKKSIGGFLGAFGFVLGLFLVPIYLFFFLRESRTIADSWADYLPLRASSFKDEVVGTLNEINIYLSAFFRGQMLVSLIDGLITAVLLSAIGLKSGLLIGVLVGMLGVIPYIGIMMCYVPAVIVATVQAANNDWYLAPNAPWWVLPMLVTIIFIAVNNLDGIFIAPKIVGQSVGLHPFTVIFSVLFWSLLLGGLLGAILAVPLTASVKVLFRRYIWQKRFGSDGPDPGRLRPPAGAPDPTTTPSAQPPPDVGDVRDPAPET